MKHTECTFGKWEMKLALLLYLYISLLLLFPTAMADKNGEPDALAQENEKLERQLAEVTDNVVKAKDTLDKLLNGTITMEDVPEQDTKQLAEIIALNFPSQYTWMTAWLLSRLFSLILSHCPKCLVLSCFKVTTQFNFFVFFTSLLLKCLLPPSHPTPCLSVSSVHITW